MRNNSKRLLIFNLAVAWLNHVSVLSASVVFDAVPCGNHHECPVGANCFSGLCRYLQECIIQHCKPGFTEAHGLGCIRLVDKDFENEKFARSECEGLGSAPIFLIHNQQLASLRQFVPFRQGSVYALGGVGPQLLMSSNRGLDANYCAVFVNGKIEFERICQSNGVICQHNLHEQQ